jgi:hypothetical protein
MGSLPFGRVGVSLPAATVRLMPLSYRERERIGAG